jgi:tetratricopeptide (TPR) repeat protein
MKQRITLLLAVYLVIAGAATDAHGSGTGSFYRYYISGDMDSWLQSMEELSDRYYRSRDFSILEDLIEARYGYIGWAIENDRKQGKKVLKVAVDEIDTYLTRYPGDVEMIALKAAFIGYQMAFRPYLAPIKGPKSLKLMDKALELEPNHPQALIQKANAEYYMPGILGGSREEALKKYRQAATIIEVRGEAEGSWQYLNLLTAIARGYEETGQDREAYRMYRKILEIEPRFAWVRDDLFPTFMKSYPNQNS